MKENKINIKFAKYNYIMANMAFEIYLQGCNIRCPSCHNKDMWSDKKSNKFSQKDFSQRIKKFDIAIRRIFITGGEPLSQNSEELIKFINFIKEFDKEVWLFTAYEMYQIPKDIRLLCDYIKTGIYDPYSGPGKEMYGFKVATANQKIYKIN